MARVVLHSEEFSIMGSCNSWGSCSIGYSWCNGSWCYGSWCNCVSGSICYSWCNGSLGNCVGGSICYSWCNGSWGNCVGGSICYSWGSGSICYSWCNSSWGNSMAGCVGQSWGSVWEAAVGVDGVETIGKVERRHCRVDGNTTYGALLAGIWGSCSSSGGLIVKLLVSCPGSGDLSSLHNGFRGSKDRGITSCRSYR
ncbi:unnamed protein product [Meganyctiphanes norvegica]|uniref:Uncharacterized protein n=1 Tax=Meganyctiphanes norvegica TaxID=48144 RepID=A0AAV2SD13_MEGNR